MDLFADVARRVANALRVPYPEEGETRARELVREYEEGRGAGR
jgi:hypothetical protein